MSEAEGEEEAGDADPSQPGDHGDSTESGLGKGGPLTNAQHFVPKDHEVLISEHDLQWYGEPLPKNVNDLVKSRGEDVVTESIAAGMLRVLYESCYPNGIHKNVKTDLVNCGASDVQLEVEQFTQANVSSVVHLLKQQELGQFLTRTRGFRVVTRWVAETLLAKASEWEWVHYDRVKKEAVPHSVGSCTPAGTTYRMAALGRVWTNASHAWTYALKAMNVETVTELADSAQRRPAPKKPRKGYDQRAHSSDSSWGAANWQQSRDDSTGYDKWQSPGGWQPKTSGPYTGGKGKSDKSTGSYSSNTGGSYSRSSSWNRQPWKGSPKSSDHSGSKDKDWHKGWTKDSAGKWHKR